MSASALLLSVLPSAAVGASGVQLHDLKLTNAAVPDAVETSVLWSQEKAPEPSSVTTRTVIIATGGSFADSLASGVMQKDKKATLLLTNAGDSALSAATKAEIARLNANNAVILGGTAAVPASIQTELTSLGLTVTRISGASRVETSVEVASNVTPANNTVMIVRGQGTGSAQYADSLAAGAWSYVTGFPVLVNVATADNPLHPAIKTYLQSKNITSVKVIGGTAAVSADTEAAIKAVVADTVRISGPNRDATANAIADQYTGTTGKVVVVDGYRPEAEGWWNGFSAAHVAGSNNAPIVLANNNTISPTSLNRATTQSGNVVAGWTGTYVSSAVTSQVESKLGATTTAKTLTSLGLTPHSTSTLEAANNAKNTLNFTATGLDASKTYVLRLVQGEQDGTGYKVSKTNSGAFIPLASTTVGFTVVNGSTIASAVATAPTAPVSGGLTARLSVANNAPSTIAYAQLMDGSTVKATSGAIVIMPQEGPNTTAFGPNGSVPTQAITAINKTEKYVIVNNQVFYYGNSGSTFFENNTSTVSAQITPAEFESKVLIGDKFGSNAYYQKATGLASAFAVVYVATPNVSETPGTHTSDTLKYTAAWTAAFSNDIWTNQAKLKLKYATLPAGATLGAVAINAAGDITNGGTALPTTNTVVTGTPDATNTRTAFEVGGLTPFRQHIVYATWSINGRDSATPALLATATSKTPAVPNNITIANVKRASQSAAALDYNVGGGGSTDALLLELSAAVPVDTAATIATPGSNNGVNINTISNVVKTLASGSGNIPVTSSTVKFVTTNARHTPVDVTAATTSKYIWVDLGVAIPDNNGGSTYTVTLPAGSFYTADGSPNAEITGTFSY